MFGATSSPHGVCYPVRLSSAGGYRLIDLDCVNKIGQPVGAKVHNGSAFAPPEMLFRDGGTILLKDASNKEKSNYQNLLASPSYDIWSFGVMLFEALGWKTLFEVRGMHYLIRSSPSFMMTLSGGQCGQYQ